MSFVTSRLSQLLKVKKIREPTRLTGISQTEVPDCNFKAEISLISDGYPSIPLKAVILDKITGDLPVFHLSSVRNKPFLQGPPKQAVTSTKRGIRELHKGLTGVIADWGDR